MPLIGITGYATAGKDTLADLLVSHYGYRKFSFSDPLMQMARVINPVLFLFYLIPFRYNWAVRLLGETRAKRIPAVRRFLQKLGTEAGREVIGEDVWVDAMLEKLSRHPGPAVITNCRFENEAQMIRDCGGLIVRVVRPGVGPVNDHKSDAGIDPAWVDLTIHNDGYPDQMDFEKVHRDAMDMEEATEDRYVPDSAQMAMLTERLEAKADECAKLSGICAALLTVHGDTVIDPDEAGEMERQSLISYPVDGKLVVRLVDDEELERLTEYLDGTEE